MGLFSSGKRLHLSSREMRRLLDRVPGLDNKEEKYVMKLLKKYRSGGISKGEITDAIRKLKYDHKDPIAKDEANKIKKALLAALDKE